MKILKLKFNVITIITFSLILFMLHSCSKTDLPQDDNHKIQENYQKASKDYYLPLSLDNATETDVKEYMKNVTPDLQVKLIEHTRIVDYLGSINKFDEVLQKAKSLEILTANNIANYLTDDEMLNLSDYNNNNIELRECGEWRFDDCADVYNADYFPLCRVNFTCWDKRDCEWHDILSARYKTTFKGSVHKCH